MPLTFEAIKAHMETFEGNVSHMYLDSVGKVTVAIGNMLPNVGSAQKLGFVDALTGTHATAAQIQFDFETVSGQQKGLCAAKYKNFTRLYLPPAEVDALFATRLQEFQQQLSDAYPGYDGFPEDARLALLDMAFNLGTFGLRRKWPKLNAAIAARNWRGAAQECNRPQIQPSRNACVRALFDSSAAEQR